MTIELDPFDDHEDTRQALKSSASWRNCTMASFEALAEAANGNARVFVWPDEGEFRGKTWHFNDQHRDEFEPLLIDQVTASMMKTLHDALNETNQAKFKDWVGKGRGHFAKLWEITEKRVTITGFKSR
jgi:cytochrome c556